jgi:ActR/RegA family two-component response regulator
VELFEEIRREYEFGVGTIAGTAKELGVHRRMVREAIQRGLAGAAEEDGAAKMEDRSGGRVR